jgi:hypothetical protein
VRTSRSTGRTKRELAFNSLTSRYYRFQSRGQSPIKACIPTLFLVHQRHRFSLLAASHTTHQHGGATDHQRSRVQWQHARQRASFQQRRIYRLKPCHARPQRRRLCPLRQADPPLGCSGARAYPQCSHPAGLTASSWNRDRQEPHSRWHQLIDHSRR